MCRCRRRTGRGLDISALVISEETKDFFFTQTDKKPSETSETFIQVCVKLSEASN